MNNYQFSVKQLLRLILFLLGISSVNTLIVAEEFSCQQYSNIVFNGLPSCRCRVDFLNNNTHKNLPIDLIAGLNNDSDEFIVLNLDYTSFDAKYANLKGLSVCQDSNDRDCRLNKINQTNGTVYFKNPNVANDYFKCDLNLKTGFSNIRVHIPGQAEPTPTPTPTPVPDAQIEQAVGSSISATVNQVQVHTTSGLLPDVSAIVTPANSSLNIKRDNGSLVEIEQGSIAVLNPPTTTNNVTSEQLTLVRGQVKTEIACSSAKEHIINTPLAKIIVRSSCPNSKRNEQSAAQVDINYQEGEVQNTLDVSVESGSVEVVDRDGKSQQLNANQQTQISSAVNRSSWILPIGGDFIYGGQENLLAWTAYAGASRYMIEYTFPSPEFSENNVTSYEFSQQLVPINVFDIEQNIVVFRVPLGVGLDGKVVSARVFALDSQGNILGNSHSSDEIRIIWRDPK